MDTQYPPRQSFSNQNELYMQNFSYMNPHGSDTPASLNNLPYTDDKVYDWLIYDDDNNSSLFSPTSTSRTSFSSPPLSPPGKRGKDQQIDDKEAERRLNRRREQNRESQQKFREKNRKAYESVSLALQAERARTSKLQDEVTVLQSTVVDLQQEKDHCLETIDKLYRSISELPSEETVYHYGR